MAHADYRASAVLAGRKTDISHSCCRSGMFSIALPWSSGHHPCCRPMQAYQWEPCPNFASAPNMAWQSTACQLCGTYHTSCAAQVKQHATLETGQQLMHAGRHLRCDGLASRLDVEGPRRRSRTDSDKRFVDLAEPWYSKMVVLLI